MTQEFKLPPLPEPDFKVTQFAGYVCETSSTTGEDAYTAETVERLRLEAIEAYKQQQQPLSHEQRDAIWNLCKYDNGNEWAVDWEHIVDAVEAAHRIGGEKSVPEEASKLDN